MSDQEQVVNIMLVDDHSLVRDGIKALLEEEPNFHVAYEASNGQEALEMITKVHPDLFIIDIRMPEMNGIELTKRLSSTNKNYRMLVLSMHDSEEYVLQSIDAGAHGYLLKDASRTEFIKAINSVLNNDLYFSGPISKYLVKQMSSTQATSDSNVTPVEAVPRPELTKREIQILQLATAGKSNQEIADLLGNSRRTVEAHRFNLMKKLKAKNLAEMILKAQEFGYLS